MSHQLSIVLRVLRVCRVEPVCCCGITECGVQMVSTLVFFCSLIAFLSLWCCQGEMSGVRPRLHQVKHCACLLMSLWMWMFGCRIDWQGGWAGTTQCRCLYFSRFFFFCFTASALDWMRCCWLQKLIKVYSLWLLKSPLCLEVIFL